MDDNKTLDFSRIEEKWQKKWEKAKAFKVEEDLKKKKFSVIEMYPYPSSSGLHMGHAFNYTLGDIFARFKRMQGFNVLYPMGYDSFGLPAENAAIKAKSHPKTFTDKSMESFIRQQKALGFSYDWNRILWSHNSEYYRWNQYFFLQFLKKGLAFRKKSPVNWCSKCNSVLANEQVHNGNCWRHLDTQVEIKNLEQWFIKTTDYADELLGNVDSLDWPERIKAMQKNWIGKSEGSEIDFELKTNANYVLLHGFNGSPERNFFPWLKKELEERGYKVDVPKLPNSDNPDITEQVEYVLKNCKFDENTVLLGHSLGSVIGLKVLEKLKSPIKKFISAAGFARPGFKDKKRPFEEKFDGKFDFEKIKKNVDQVIILRAENDTAVPAERADSLKDKIGGEIIDFRAKENHITGKIEPSVLKHCLDIWPIFTTRADTLMGVTFLVVSAQHSKLIDIVSKEQKKEVEGFLKKLKSTKQEDIDKLEKEGVFTGSYALHPLTREKIPIWAGNFVLADYGSGMVMAVPAHDQRDYEFAKKYKIPIKQVIAPSFVVEKGLDAVRKDKPIIERDSVFGIVKHWKEDKYLCLDWKNFGWKSFIIGGIENGENSEDAVRREVIEETGYDDIKSVEVAGFDTYSTFFARHKDINRKARYKVFLVELGSDKYSKPEEEHTKNHEAVWVEKNKVASFLNLDNNSYLWKNYINGGEAFTDYGILVNSEGFDGLESDKARVDITKVLEEKGKARFVVNYKLRDWLVSRQRYWGTPIPVIYCSECGIVGVEEKELPVLLPEDVKFGEGNPLETSKKFVETKCPKCKGKARRETDTMDTFFDSSWYYLRYCDSKNKKLPFDSKKAEYWMPVDFYVGGAEHACMHLIYARFFTKALRDLGFIKLDEPFRRLFNQGMVHGEDGTVMSKSKGNGIDPLEVSQKYGADALRLFLVSMASPDKDFAWSYTGVESSFKFVNKVYNFALNASFGKSSKKTEHKINLAIRDITKLIEDLKYNLVVIRLRELIDSLEGGISKEDLGVYIKLISPFCPHVAEELWEKIGGKGFVSLADWPIADESKIDMKLEESEKNVEKAVGDILNVLKIVKEKQGKEGKKIYLYIMPNEFEGYNMDVLTKRIGLEVKVFAVNDKQKYDPEGKSSKAKPGKPGIFIE